MTRHTVAAGMAPVHIGVLVGMMGEQQGDLPDRPFLTIISVLWDSLLEGTALIVEAVQITMVNFRNHGIMVVVPVHA